MYDFEVIGDLGLGTQKTLKGTDSLDEALEAFNSEQGKFMLNGWTTLSLLFADRFGEYHTIKKSDIDDEIRL